MDGYDYTISPFTSGVLDESELHGIKHLESDCLSHKRHKHDSLIPRHEPKRIINRYGIPGEVKYEPTINDVVEAYGYNKDNVTNLNRVSERIREETKALSIINNLDKSIDLVEVMNACPSFGSKFRAVLSDAFSKQLKDDLEMSKKLYDYLYGEAPKDDTTTDIDTSEDNDLVELI